MHSSRVQCSRVNAGKCNAAEFNAAECNAAEVNAAKKRIDFGSQIRSYVLQPYQQVKDLRTGHASGAVDKVLDGDVTDFMESWLAMRASEEGAK